MADELRTEQEHGLAADKANKMMVSQCNEMQSRLADVEAMALRHGKKIIAKLEERCRALEDELGNPTLIFLIVSYHTLLYNFNIKLVLNNYI